MSAHQAQYPIATLCSVLEVSTSGYYAWKRRPASRRAQEDQRLLQKIRTSHLASRSSYGAPRIHEDLRELGVRVGRKRIARLMRAAAIVGVTRRRWIRTTVRDPQARPAPDRVQRRFCAQGPNELWVADISVLQQAA